MSSRKGFVYDTTSRAAPGNVSPEASDYTNVVDVGILENGIFSESVTGLAQDTTYYFRAFTYDEAKYKYSAEASFTTLGSISGGQFAPTGYRLWCATLSGTQYCQYVGSITGVQSLCIYTKDSIASRGLITLSATHSVSIDGSGNITTSGLTGVTILETVVGAWTLITINFDAITVNQLEVGRVGGSYYEGLLDEFGLFSKQLTADDRTQIRSKQLDRGTALYDDFCELYWSFDNCLAGNFEEEL